MINFKNKNNDNQNISKCENSATNIYLIKPHESKCLYDEVNDYLKIMKKGEYFSKIINSKGRTTTYLLKLSQDETIISLLLNRICIYETEIYVENISNCEIGHSNNFYSSKKFENFFTIELNDNQFYEFYHYFRKRTIKTEPAAPRKEKRALLSCICFTSMELCITAGKLLTPQQNNSF